MSNSSNQDSPLNDLLGKLSGFDLEQLAGRCSAAQLCPENGSHLLRLEYFNTVLGSLTPTEDPHIMSAGKFKRILSGGMGVSHLEDPRYSPFITAMTFVGGDYRVIPGDTDHIQCSVETLLTA